MLFSHETDFFVREKARRKTEDKIRLKSMQQKRETPFAESLFHGLYEGLYYIENRRKDESLPLTISQRRRPV